MTRRLCVKLEKSLIESGFLDTIDYVLTDCDGVLWLENDAIPGSVEAIQALNNMGKPILYITNNSTKSRDEYAKKCESLGFPATPDSIISSSYCAAAYLKSLDFKKKVYVFGTKGITDELEKANIDYLPIGPDPIPGDFISFIKKLELDPDVGAVVVGFDPHVSYPKLTKAASYLKNPETLFIASNRDEKFPTSRNIIIPGSGTFVSAIEIVSDRKAVSLGKPETYMLDCARMIHPNIDFSRCLMIGDRLNTDIMFGTKHGLKTLLVLTGINTLDDIHAFEKSDREEDQLLVPDYYLPSLGDLLSLIKE